MYLILPNKHREKERLGLPSVAMLASSSIRRRLLLSLIEFRSFTPSTSNPSIQKQKNKTKTNPPAKTTNLAILKKIQ
jgi:predicted house-cleaning NTP pyrophosphatase (Maf/HAM1 superfamily)